MPILSTGAQAHREVGSAHPHCGVCPHPGSCVLITWHSTWLGWEPKWLLPPTQCSLMLSSSASWTLGFVRYFLLFFRASFLPSEHVLSISRILFSCTPFVHLNMIWLECHFNASVFGGSFQFILIPPTRRAGSEHMRALRDIPLGGGGQSSPASVLHSAQEWKLGNG